MQQPTSSTCATLLTLDEAHLCHPYASPLSDPTQPVLLVESAQGVHLSLADGRQLIDGISSWWSVCHGHNHPKLNQALQDQLAKMAHVMFAGLTHEPAIRLAQSLVELTPKGLEHVFFSDSGSVSVEVGCKIVLQYWQAKGRTHKTQFLALEHGYHGDTFGTMALADPERSMHSPFTHQLTQHLFVPSPSTLPIEQAIQALEQSLKAHHSQLAGFILEPLLQGAGGMLTYPAAYLNAARQLCDQYDVLLLVDEIATGFGRTGHLFACEAAGISPDVMMLGKGLTGGYMSLAATVFTHEIAQTIAASKLPAIMHGPTFMANPLACAVAHASLELFKQDHWQTQVAAIEAQLSEGLSDLKHLPHIKAVRILGAMAAIEFHQPIDLPAMRNACVEAGVWLRPFGHVLYTTPPFIIEAEELEKIIRVIRRLSEATTWLMPADKKEGVNQPIC